MTAARLGISLSEYNDMTPHELNIYIQAYKEKIQYENDKMQADYETAITIAYLQARWTIQWLGKNKPDPLHKILGIKPKEQTPEEMLEEIKRLNMEMGGNTA